MVQHLDYLRCGRAKLFNEYIIEHGPKLHPAGLPQLWQPEVEELLAKAHDKLWRDNLPVTFMGFTAGAYLSMTIACILHAEFPGRVGVVAMGHKFFPSERMEQRAVPGIVILGVRV